MEMAWKLGAALEPRMTMMVLTSVTDNVIRDDDILKQAWSDRVMQPKLRTQVAHGTLWTL
eukprot:3686135-Prorocentrum_lima.AAC.1